MFEVSGSSWRANAVAPRRSNRPGFALEATLIVMVLISALILAAMTGVIATQRTTTVDTANAEALLVAEGGADAVMGQLSSYMSDGFISDAELGTIATPSVPGWTFDPVTATKIGTPQIQTIAHGDFAGLVSYNQQIDLHVRAHDTRNNRGDVIITADAQAIPVFQFGVFYDGDLEILPGAAMTFEGWVHTNGDLYLTAASSRFMSLLTTPDSLVLEPQRCVLPFGRCDHRQRVGGPAGADIRLTRHYVGAVRRQQSFDVQRPHSHEGLRGGAASAAAPAWHSAAHDHRTACSRRGQSANQRRQVRVEGGLGHYDQFERRRRHVDHDPFL